MSRRRIIKLNQKVEKLNTSEKINNLFLTECDMVNYFKHRGIFHTRKSSNLFNKDTNFNNPDQIIFLTGYPNILNMFFNKL